MSDNDTLFWRLLALFQTLPELQPVQVVDWLAQECGETLTPARLTTLTQPQLAASFPSATAVMSPARWARVIACLQGVLPGHLRIARPLSERRSCGSLFARRMAWPSMVILARTGCFLSMPSMTRAAGWRICAAMRLLLRRRTPARCAPGCWRIAICCFVRRLAGLPPRD